MTSIGSFTKQIPLNNAYYRAVRALLGEEDVVEYLYVPTASNSMGMITTFGPASVDQSLVDPMNTGLFKDMGRQEVVNGSTFRRVQYVAPGLVNGIGGTVPDYLTYYICLGFGGNGAPGGPFIRTG
jgi:hypothetical protein